MLSNIDNSISIQTGLQMFLGETPNKSRDLIQQSPSPQRGLQSSETRMRMCSPSPLRESLIKESDNKSFQEILDQSVQPPPDRKSVQRKKIKLPPLTSKMRSPLLEHIRSPKLDEITEKDEPQLHIDSSHSVVEIEIIQKKN